MHRNCWSQYMTPDFHHQRAGQGSNRLGVLQEDPQEAVQGMEDQCKREAGRGSGVSSTEADVAAGVHQESSPSQHTEFTEVAHSSSDMVSNLSPGLAVFVKNTFLDVEQPSCATCPAKLVQTFDYLPTVNQAYTTIDSLPPPPMDIEGDTAMLQGFDHKQPNTEMDRSQVTVETLRELAAINTLGIPPMENPASTHVQQHCFENMGLSVKNTFLDVDQRGNQAGRIRMVQSLDGLPFVDVGKSTFFRTEEELPPSW